jgi:hypothetical protein
MAYRLSQLTTAPFRHPHRILTQFDPQIANQFRPGFRQCFPARGLLFEIAYHLLLSFPDLAQLPDFVHEIAVGTLAGRRFELFWDSRPDFGLREL